MVRILSTVTTALWLVIGLLLLPKAATSFWEEFVVSEEIAEIKSYGSLPSKSKWGGRHGGGSSSDTNVVVKLHDRGSQQDECENLVIGVMGMMTALMKSGDGH